jgi:hypothetical protein
LGGWAFILQIIHFVCGMLSGRAAKASFGKGGGIRGADDGGLYFAAGEICGADKVCTNPVHFVHFASQNTIPTALLDGAPLPKGP